MTIEALAKELDFDVEDVELVLEAFLETAEQNIEKLKTAAKAEDFETMHATAHTIKGSASNLLLETIVDNALYVEKSANEKKHIDYSSSISKIEDALEAVKTKMQ